jgi:hypothetical protein
VLLIPHLLHSLTGHHGSPVVLASRFRRSSRISSFLADFSSTPLPHWASWLTGHRGIAVAGLRRCASEGSIQGCRTPTSTCRPPSLAHRGITLIWASPA